MPASEPPSKRRRVHDQSLNSTPRDSSSEEAVPGSPPETTRLTDQNISIRRGPPSSPPLSENKHQSPNPNPGDHGRRYRSSESTSRSRSRSQSSARSRSRSILRSRSRSAPYSHSRSHSGSRSRSASHPRSRSPDLSSSTTPHPTSHAEPDHHHHHRRGKLPLLPNYRSHLLLQGHTAAISQVRISPDGRWIASASADGTAKIWDASTGVHLETLVGHMAGVSCLAWAPDSDTLATGSDDKAIRLWDRVTGSPAHDVAHRDNSSEGMGSVVMKGVAMRAAARRARIGVPGEGVRGGRTGRGPLLGHHNYVYSLAFSPKGNILVSGSYDEAVFLWDVRAGRLMRSLPAHSDPVSGVGFCRDGTLVVSCSTDGLIRVWDTSTGQCLRTLVHEDNPAVANVCFSPNGRFVLAFSLDSSIRLWDYVSGSVKKTYQGHTNKGFSIGGCFGLLTDEDDGMREELPDEETGSRQRPFIASASEEGDIVMWDVKSKEVIQRIKGAHQGVCFCVDIHGTTMVSAGQDGLIKLFKHRPRNDHPKREDSEANAMGDTDARLGDAPDPTTADEELQRQVEAEAESPGQRVKEEQV
ncbi:WD40-repeat-containing domain protein [Chaetomium sp. MPI-SDFR-AT-0129]|nr:WD40-repeat-containing domain protein [Chaetomium sp. MPI-SDFR-AT-0129]